MAENANLRQQVIILNRQVKRPKFTTRDRFRLVFLSRLTRFWHTALHLVQPETLLRWHRDLFRLYWKRKTKPKDRKPRIPQETIDLIKQMAIENPHWGAKKIRGELLKLEIYVHKRTTKRYMRQVRIKEATPWDNRPKYLIRDNDKKFGKRFSAVAEATNIKEFKTPFQAPKANAICERFMGSLKREALDFHFILHPYQLWRIVNAYVDYYNQARPHQGIEQHIPAQFNRPRFQLARKPKGKVIATPVLNGLHHTYAYADALN